MNRFSFHFHRWFFNQASIDHWSEFKILVNNCFRWFKSFSLVLHFQPVTNRVHSRRRRNIWPPSRSWSWNTFSSYRIKSTWSKKRRPRTNTNKSSSSWKVKYLVWSRIHFGVDPFAPLGFPSPTTMARFLWVCAGLLLLLSYTNLEKILRWIRLIFEPFLSWIFLDEFRKSQPGTNCNKTSTKFFCQICLTTFSKNFFWCVYNWPIIMFLILQAR